MGGPGISQSALVINMTDLAEHVGASLKLTLRDSYKERENEPTVFASVIQDADADKLVGLMLAEPCAAGPDQAGRPPVT